MGYDTDYSMGSNYYPYDNYSVGNSYDAFHSPAYLVQLKKRTDILYRTYSALHASHYDNLEADPQLKEMANLLGFGLLMRHALEAISVDLIKRTGCDDLLKETVHKRLTAIEGKNVSGYSPEQEHNLFYVLDRTNKIAHPYVLKEVPTYESFVALYRSTFRPLIDFHIRLTTNRTIRRYLTSMRDRMDSFNLKDRITRTLTLGNLIRQLTECTANFWCYNNYVTPTDASTSEDPVPLSKVLAQLRNIARASTETGIGASSMNNRVIDALFNLKNTTNALMHVDHYEIGLFTIWRTGLKLRHLHTAIVAECSPDALELKTNSSALKKTEVKLTLLCGFFGWFGVHHFYAGNILKGIFFLLTFGCLFIGPPINLINIYRGRFRTKKWGQLNSVSKTTRFLVIAFFVLYIALYYLLISQ